MMNILSALIIACGPFFPISYFPHEYDWQYKDGEWVSEKHYGYEYTVREHLGTELAILGAHYYPDWVGKSPKSNKVSTGKADELDFFAAGQKAQVKREEVERAWKNFVAFEEGVCARLEAGEKVEVPRNIPKFTREFYLYKLGHAEWLVFRKDEDPSAFGELMKLPKAERLYRTVWVHFVRIANATKYAEKDRHLAAFRKSLDEGYKDTAGLEAFTLRFLSATCGLRYEPLILCAFQNEKSEEWPGFVKRIFTHVRYGKVPEGIELAKLCEDQVGVEVAVAYGLGDKLPKNAAVPEHPVLEADRQAWIAFEKGDLELCKKLLKMAKDDSLIKLFLEARLARLEGDYKKAAMKLGRWLEVYKAKGEAVVGYGVGGCDAYWDSGLKYENEDWGYWGSLYYFGKFGPANEFSGPFGIDYKPHEIGESSAPTLPRVIVGELGLVKVATRDLEEALYAFLQARNWLDIAFVAERCLTIDELIKVMKGTRIEERYRENLGNLLARRLMRVGRVEEAIEWAPKELKKLIVEYQELMNKTVDKKASNDTRAIAYFNLSRLVATRGMELMGTELRPDGSIFDGNYSYDGASFSEPKELAKILKTDEKVWKGWVAPNDRVDKRFHYRYKAIEFAREAVNLAKDEDVRAWSLMLGGVVTLSVNDTKAADWFYKKLAKMHHPKAKVGGWFTGNAFTKFREKYYNEERHLETMRVPPRFTLETFKVLDFGK